VRRPIVLATALVAGLGAALVLAVPVNAAGIFTSQKTASTGSAAASSSTSAALAAQRTEAIRLSRPST